MQNPALGAVAIWRAAVGYSVAHRQSLPMLLPLTFLVLPLVLMDDTRDQILATRSDSGLRRLVEKLESSKIKRVDSILAIHDRALRWRRLTLQSIQIGVATGLISLDAQRPAVEPLSKASPRLVSERTRPLLRAAESIGKWMAPLSPYEISALLHVRF